jgi:hypothetical protein
MAKLSVSKTELGGSNPSAPAKELGNRERVSGISYNSAAVSEVAGSGKAN